MAVSFPTSLDNFTNPLPNDKTNAPVTHSQHHSNHNDAIEALEAKVGADGSAVTSSHDYKLSEVTGSDKAVGKTATQTLTNKTLTSPTINSGNINNTTLNNATFDTNSIVTLASNPSISKAGIQRQAIINGNFTVWQNGTSFTNPSNNQFTADRWQATYTMGGTPPSTITHSRLDAINASLPGSKFYYRMQFNGAGSGFGANDNYNLLQLIHGGTHLLAGTGNKVTLSFRARSNVASKKIGFYLLQSYGSGGSPSPVETINGSNYTLSSDWQQYTYTFTLNTLNGKTFGTNNNDALRLMFPIMWGDDYAPRVGAGSAETFVGSGYVDIAEVQINGGDIALPFQAKSITEELTDCMFYHERLGYRWDGTENTDTVFGTGFMNTPTQANIFVPFSQKQRNPTIALSGNSTFRVLVAGGALTVNGISVVGNTTTGIILQVTTSTGTAGQACILQRADGQKPYIDINAEI